MSDTSPTDAPIVNAGTIPVRPTKYIESLQDSLAKEVANQATRMDDLAKLLITINLAIPALYGAIIKLSQTPANALPSLLIIIAFASWLGSLWLAIVALLPVKNRVDPNNLPAIERYFSANATRKQTNVVSASFLTFFGICLVIFGLIL
jgi:hypothetical protein